MPNAMEFRKPFAQNLSERPRDNRVSTLLELQSVLGQNLFVETWMLLGAVVQTTLILVAPWRVAVLPAVVLLAMRLINTILVTTGATKNPYLRNAIHKKLTAQVLDDNGEIAKPGQEKVAVLLLGFKANHPLGLFSHGAKEVSSYAEEMYKYLDSPDGQRDNGFLGFTSWTRLDENGAQELINISYWRSAEAVHAYSQSPLHLKAIQWWNSHIKEVDHLGIMHEIFEAPPGLWESVYVNFQPTLLGRTAYVKKGDKLEGGVVSDEWVSPLFEARGKFRTSNGRRGLAESAGSQAMDYYPN